MTQNSLSRTLLGRDRHARHRIGGEGGIGEFFTIAGRLDIVWARSIDRKIEHQVPLLLSLGPLPAALSTVRQVSDLDRRLQVLF